MEIKVTTVCDYNTYKDYYRFSLSNGKDYRLVFIILIAFNIFLLYHFFQGIIISEFDLLFSFLLFLFIVFDLLILNLVFIMPKRNYKLNGHLYGIPNEFTFFSDEFSVSSNSENYSGTSIIKYESVVKICERENFFYIFIGNNIAYVIKKSDIVNGTQDDLKNIFSNKISEEKYIYSK